MLCIEVCPCSYFRSYEYFQDPWVSFVAIDVFSVRFTKITSGLVSHELSAYLSVLDLFLIQWIMAISKGCKPHNYESHYSLKLTFTNIWGLRSNFLDCESILESNSPDILALCETNLDDSLDSGYFSVMDYRR